jgi:hypothetical protein
VGCFSQGGSAGTRGGTAGWEEVLLEVTDLRRRVVGTGCCWGQSHCQRQRLTARKAMQDLHGSSQIIWASESVRGRGLGSYEDPHMNRA